MTKATNSENIQVGQMLNEAELDAVTGAMTVPGLVCFEFPSLATVCVQLPPPPPPKH